MSPDHLKRISELWDSLSEVPAHEHDRWLAALEARDQSLIPALRTMVAGANEPSRTALFGRLPAMTDVGLESMHARHADAAPVDERIGPYRLIRRLGRGGMGEVWLASPLEGPVRREVALKLPLLSTRLPPVRRRFERECAILSSLSHPNIARLYDAGVWDDRAFIAMEYVEGVPITRYCDDLSMPIVDRVRLFLHLTAAVAFAHANFVVHRDLKPANILVTTKGTLQLLDFGVAKVMYEGAADTGATPLTEWAGNWLTPEYASPEQIRQSPIGPPSDIYSLGVVLYELLCGSRPYKTGDTSRHELEQAVIGGALRPMTAQADGAVAAARGESQRHLAAQLKGDLDIIVMKALQAEPARRYASVMALEEDLQRWVDRKPIVARPPSWRYVSWRFAQRHVVGLSAAAIVLATMAAATGVSVYQAMQARQQARLAGEEASRAQAISSFMTGVFGINGRTGDDVQAARRRTARELLEQGVERLRADKSLPDKVRYDLLGTFAKTYNEMGLVESSLGLGRERIALAERIFGRDAFESVQPWIDVAWGYSSQGITDQAVAAASHAEAILRRQPGSSSQLADAWMRFAAVATDAGGRGDVNFALSAVTEAWRWSALSADQAAVTDVYQNAGMLLLQTGRCGDALTMLRRAAQSLEAQGPDARARGWGVFAWLGTAELYNGQLDDASKHLKAAVDLSESSTVAVDEQGAYQFLWRLADVSGRFDEGIAQLKVATDRVRAIPDARKTQTMALLYSFEAKLALRAGRVEQALDDLGAGRQLFITASRSAGLALDPGEQWGGNPLAWALANLEAGRLDKTAALLDEFKRENGDEGKAYTFRTMTYRLGWLQLALARRDVGRARAEVTALRSAPEPITGFQVYQGWTLDTLESNLARLEGRFDASERLARSVLSTIAARSDAGVWQDHLARAHQALGMALLADNRAAESKPELQEAVRLFDRTQASGLSLDEARTLEWLARANVQLRDAASALTSERAAHAIWKQHASLQKRPGDAPPSNI